MYCPKCGNMLDPGANFCVVCGAPADPDRDGGGYLETYRSDGNFDPSRGIPPRPRGTLVRNAAVALVVAVLAFAIIVPMLTEEPAETVERSYTVEDLTLTGGLCADDILAETSGGDAVLRYTGSGEPSWYWLDACGTAFVPETDAGGGTVYSPRDYEPHPGEVMTISEPGMYDIVLMVDGRQYAEGTAVLDGDIINTYTWMRVDGVTLRSYSFEFTFRFSDYLGYAERDEKRSDNYDLPRSRFVAVDDTIVALEEALAAEYLEVHGRPGGTGQDYADYLLSFVQAVFAYPTPISPGPDGVYREDQVAGFGDMMLNGADEYWSFPLETLYHGMGDCEDTSFLLCALYSAAGYRSAIVVPPGHMMVGVAIEGYEQPLNLRGYEVGSLRTSEGVYHLCETTFDQPVDVGLYSPSMKHIVGQVKSVEPVPPLGA